MPLIQPIFRAIAPGMLLLLQLAGCGCQGPLLPPATGSFMDIVVLGEPSPQGAEELRHVLGGSFPPLRSGEVAFRLSFESRSLRTKPREKNVLVLGRNASSEEWDEALGKWITPAARDTLARRGAARLFFRDVWARGQMVALLVAPDGNAMDALIGEVASNLQREFLASAIQRCTTNAWPDTASAEARALRQRQGIVLAVPGTFRPTPVSPSWPEAMEWVRTAPSRSLTLFWIDGIAPETPLTESFLLGMQQDAMWRLHGDEMVDGVWDAPDLSVTPRLLRGSWQNRRDVAGGHFVTYFVYDSSRRRLYGVQGLLFAPGRRKAVYLVELEGLVRTFRVESAT